MYAYDQTLLNKARTTLASMFDYAVNDCGIDLAEFYNCFLASANSDAFARGDSKTIAGQSGIELARDIMENMYDRREFVPPAYKVQRSPEYWLGSSLAYFQWQTGQSFEEITECVSIDILLSMYDKYHEMDVHQFIDALLEIQTRQRGRALSCPPDALV